MIGVGKIGRPCKQVHSKFGILELGYEGPNVCAIETPIGSVACSMFWDTLQ
jgi:hypothetical protein